MDFDLTSDESAPEDGVVAPAHLGRTGTQPFMAMDLLRPEPMCHLPRHDLGSFFYVIIWHTSRYNDATLVVDGRNNSPLKEWERLPYNALRIEKYNAIGEMRFPPPTSNWKSFHGVRLRLAKLFQGYQQAIDAYSTRAAIAADEEWDEDSDEEGEQGEVVNPDEKVVTHDKFLVPLRRLVQKLSVRKGSNLDAVA